MKKFVKYYLLVILLFLCTIIAPVSFCKYSTTMRKTIKINANQPKYQVKFDANTPTGQTATGTMENQEFEYGTPQALSANAYEIDTFTFIEWNTNSDGSGTSYKDKQSVDKLASQDGEVVTLYAQWRNAIIEIDGTPYATLQEAINAVPKDNTETVIRVYADLTESVEVFKNQNIVFDLKNNTINNNGTAAIISNKGTITIQNGTLSSTTRHAAINNESSGKVIMTGGTITGTTRQAIYNNGGIVEISGDSYLYSESSDRATVTNIGNGSLTITGGTIIGTKQQAVTNDGTTLVIGANDGNIDKNTPILQGATYGLTSSKNYSFFDGTIKGKTDAIENKSGATVTVVDEYNIVPGKETIDNIEYKTAFVGKSKTVTFDANGGTVTETSRIVELDHAIGQLPEPIKDGGFLFKGWYTSSEDGELIDENTIIEEDVTYYAHWEEIFVANINGTNYKTLTDAIAAVPTNNTETVVTISYDTVENITIQKNQNIVFDFQGHTIRNKGDLSVIKNNGTVKITNGTITSNSNKASAIDNYTDGRLIITGGRVIATGDRQAVYNDKGYVEISGDAYFESAITSEGNRGTVQNLTGSTMVITGGTIVSKTDVALHNEGTMTIGSKDGNIEQNTPVFQGELYGIRSTKSFTMYDGIAKGITSAINDETKISEIEDNSILEHTSEEIDEKTYDVAFIKGNE